MADLAPYLVDRCSPKHSTLKIDLKKLFLLTLKSRVATLEPQ